jgi:hypothetical protein
LESLEIDLLKKITDLGVGESRDESFLNATAVLQCAVEIQGKSEAASVRRTS